MSGAGLEVLLEDLIPEIAYSGEKGESHALSLLSTPSYALQVFSALSWRLSDELLFLVNLGTPESVARAGGGDSMIGLTRDTPWDVISSQRC